MMHGLSIYAVVNIIMNLAVVMLSAHGRRTFEL
jgi:hypothetical protein